MSRVTPSKVLAEVSAAVPAACRENIVIIGSAPIKMTDYKMKPPVITLLGIPTMSVGDDLKITFEWQLAKKVQPAPAPAK